LELGLFKKTTQTWLRFEEVISSLASKKPPSSREVYVRNIVCGEKDSDVDHLQLRVICGSNHSGPG
jgi:hypothetical protein